MQKQEQTTITPSVFRAIIGGFDLTAKHLWLLIVPVLLDLFFWLGPRLHFQTLIEQLVASLPQEPELLDLAAPLLEAAPRANLFTVLSVPFVGVPTLMATLSPETLPVIPGTLDVGSWWAWIALLAGFMILGLLFTAVFYVMITAVVSPGTDGPDWRSWPGRIGTAWKRLLVLALFFVAISMVVYVPISVIGGLIFVFFPPLGTLILLIAPFMLIWAVIYLSMAPQIITLYDQPALRAARESMRFVQKNLLAVLLLLLLILLLGTVVDWLLILAENGTWFTLINILGHAFVSTALVTALFVFYRDRSTLLGAPAAD
jgi:hypothetical protein